MDELVLNKTPLRTANNYQINDIKLKNICIPEELKEFQNVEISGNSEAVKFEENKKNIKYGVGDLLVRQANESSNKNIKIELKSNEDVDICFNFDKNNKELVDSVYVKAKKGANSNLIIKYKSEEDLEYFHNGIIKLEAEEDSTINVIVVNLLNTNSNNFMTIDNLLAENSNVNYTIIDFGGKNSISNYYSNMQGDSSKSNLNAIYLGKENQLFDINYIAEIFGKKADVNIEVQGALKDNSKKHFKGTIDFKNGAKKAKGNENEFCILLSENAKSISLPMLLCTEDDVEGTHSTASGKVDQKELFYIMSRGFSYKEAIKLIVRAKFNQIITSINNKDLEDEILLEIDRRLD